MSAIVEPGSVDLLVAFDVFEQLDRPEFFELLDEIRRGLKPSGLLLGRVPSGDSPFSRATQDGDLTHRTVLGSSAILQVSRELKFYVEAIREPEFPILGLGIRCKVRRSLVRTTRRLVYPFINHLMMGGENPVLTPNLMFVLRWPEW